ncbi:MAG TPA: phosphotransferase, partial [Gammaproteobacteria bacterium]|nr:phosphotransferase [Gammaproteobacteria bacterium]
VTSEHIIISTSKRGFDSPAPSYDAPVNAANAPLPDAAVLEAFDLEPASLTPARSGLINGTWHARSKRGRRLVLQRLNPIFPPGINADIDCVTRHLASRGIATPRLVPTTTGELWIRRSGATWRSLTEIDGVTRDALETPAQAGQAGNVLAAFHRAVADLDHRFSNARLGVHDTRAHLAALRDSLERFRSHRHYAAIAALAAEVLAAAAELPPLPPGPDRIVHGDPKVSNIVFERGTDRAVCLIDLDTLARMPVALELGDALRSWCHPGREDAPSAAFSVPLFEAAVRGYADAAGGWLTEPEWSAFADATLTITLELAARFCKDALAERYFGWDSRRYASASEHNQARTRCQLMLAASIRQERVVLQAILEAAFAPQRIA